MKIELAVDGRSYAGSPKDIVEKLHRADIHAKTRNLDAYIETMSERLREDGWGDVQVEGETLEARCESLLVALVRCRLVRPVISRTSIDGDAIRVARRANDLSQESLASLLGVAFSTVNRWENDGNAPRGTSADALEQKLFRPLQEKLFRPLRSKTAERSSTSQRTPPLGRENGVARFDELNTALAAAREQLETLTRRAAETLAQLGIVVVPRGVAVHGDLTGRTVRIEGQVEGLVEAEESIVLVKGCRVIGALRAATIAIEDGASFRGTVTLDDNDALVPLPPGARRSSRADFEAKKEKVRQLNKSVAGELSS